MPPRLLNLGHNNYIASTSIAKTLPIISSQPLITRRIRNEAKQEGKLINCSQGRAAKTIIILTSGHIVLTSKDQAAIHHGLLETEFDDQ